ncbi:glycosyltransferase family 2 protein [Aerosakkonema sp. BLCC-F183]|uniref:glycosyltransferase family 2 protein n=1 Tax=Aerosakkonema sp. BLCC-F183 TaxID=3342834 RepID=UPI0035BB85E3
MKTVSVVIPVYKVEKYIAATVQSVLAQTYKNFELLIVDDGSPDRSIEICQKFTDPRLKIIRQENQGVSAARNTGIRYAQGEYLAFLDGDDLWLPEKLEKHILHLENFPNVGVSFSRSAFIDETGKPLNLYQMPKLNEITPDLIFCRNPIGNGSAPVIRREVLKSIKFEDSFSGKAEPCYFDPRLHHFEDVECWLRIALKTNWEVEGIPEALTLYRVNLKGASTNISKQLEDLEKVIEKTRAYAPELVERCANRARAYELRFLARRSVSLRNGKAAVELAHRALATHWRIFIEEPRRTLLTLGAAYSLCLFPQSFYRQIEEIALKITGAAQKRRILQEQPR